MQAAIVPCDLNAVPFPTEVPRSNDRTWPGGGDRRVDFAQRRSPFGVLNAIETLWISNSIGASVLRDRV